MLTSCLLPAPTSTPMLDLFPLKPVHITLSPVKYWTGPKLELNTLLGESNIIDRTVTEEIPFALEKIGTALASVASYAVVLVQYGLFNSQPIIV